MAFYPDVQPGQKFRPSVKLENDIRHMLNQLNGPMPGSFKGKVTQNGELLFYPCINSTDATLPDRCAVAFEGVSGRALSVTKARDNFLPWGVLMQALAPGEQGKVAIAGAIDVQASGSGDYIAPSWTNPGALIRNDHGEPILGALGGGKYIIRLTGREQYIDEERPFKAYIGADWRLHCNGGAVYTFYYYFDPDGGSMEIHKQYADPASWTLPTQDKMIVWNSGSGIVLKDDAETGDIELAIWFSEGQSIQDYGVNEILRTFRD